MKFVLEIFYLLAFIDTIQWISYVPSIPS